MKSINLTAHEARAFASERPPTLVVRTVRPQPSKDARIMDLGHDGQWVVITGNHQSILHCPFGSPGDVLAGREAHRYIVHPELYDAVEYLCDEAIRKPTGLDNNTGFRFSQLCDIGDTHWAPPQHMPPWAVRTFIRTVSVAVKRVQEITFDEARMAVGKDVDGIVNELGNYRERWDATHKPGLRWDDNIPCWFAVVERTERADAE
jgi:hypothetical protein